MGRPIHAAVVAVARDTFDVEFGRELVDAALAVLVEAGLCVPSDVDVLTKPSQLLNAIGRHTPDIIVVLQATFTDASAVIYLAERFDVPIVVWSFPERRAGGRLRLNSMCGANLAAFSLRRRNHHCAFVHTDPTHDSAASKVLTAIERAHQKMPSARTPSVGVSVHALSTSGDPADDRTATQSIEQLTNSRVGVIGDPPVGFEPCEGDTSTVESTFGVRVERIHLNELFTGASLASADRVSDTAHRIDRTLDIDRDLSPSSLEPSQRLYCGLRQIADDRHLDAIATRCWPECMEVFGGAACTAQALLTDDGIPAVCEADMLGAVTALVLRLVSGGDPFVADLVDLDESDDTSVLWHCGLAAPSLAHPDHRSCGTAHPIRGIPLANEFPLRPGRVTVARVSQSPAGFRLVIAGGNMLNRPRPFDGTCGIIQWDLSGRDVVDTVFDLGVEHHLGLVYGEHRDALVELARRWNIPVLRLGDSD
jgi:L-fucose isomerase-like protein